MKLIITFLIIGSFLACSEEEFKLRPGDLLFQEWDASPFAQAINAVTDGWSGNDYAHIGLVMEHNNEMVVMEAVIDSGVVFTPLNSFLEASVDSIGQPRITVGRIKKDYSEYLPDISKWISERKNAAYDTLFIYGNEKYYCAELIHDAFNIVIGEEIFSLAPMTFKIPDSTSYFPIWESYFRELNARIPEGEVGINPGLMSRSTKINIVHQYNGNG